MIYFIIGMHRSCTSATSRIVNLMGIPIGEEAEQDGDYYHWENDKLRSIGDVIFKRFNTTWKNPHLPDDWENDPLLDDLIDRVTNEFNKYNKYNNFAWKDPRTCILFPFWKRFINQNYKFIYCVRNPLSVAESLRVRDGMNEVKSLECWYEYNKKCFELIKTKPSIKIHIEDYYNNKDILYKLYNFLNESKMSIETMDKIDNFLCKKKIHHRKNLDDFLNSNAASHIKELYTILLENTE